MFVKISCSIHCPKYRLQNLNTTCVQIYSCDAKVGYGSSTKYWPEGRSWIENEKRMHVEVAKKYQYEFSTLNYFSKENLCGDELWTCIAQNLNLYHYFSQLLYRALIYNLNFQILFSESNRRWNNLLSVRAYRLCTIPASKENKDLKINLLVSRELFTLVQLLHIKNEVF